MRHLIATTCLLLATTASHAAAPAGVDYLEPSMAAAAEHPDHGKIFIFFCGHCPSARKMMGSQVKELQDAVVSTQAPLEIVCLSPELEGEALRQYAQAVGLDSVALGCDRANSRKISLNNIYQFSFEPGRGGQQLRVALPELTKLAADPDSHAKLGSYTFDPTGISDPKLRQLWWAIENRQPGAVGALAGAAKKAKADDPDDAQLLALYDAVAGTLLPEVERLMAVGEDFATYEQLEAALIAAEGLDVRDGIKRLKELGRDKQIKLELKARSAYLSCMALMASPKDKDRDAAKAGLAQLAEKMPDTVYGAKAAR